ncbi:MAG: sensor histidine kinase [Flaviflexus sp.]|uniref:sensor histidine kinase n=1 Tax=Flaviflexus sp. TaxID=1969482 RepID=UPI003F9382B8
MKPMSPMTRARWRYEPHDEFTTKESRRLYRTFAWSLWGLILFIPVVLIGPMMVTADFGHLSDPFTLTFLLPGLIILAVVYGKWLFRGSDLRERSTQLEAASLFVVPAITAIAAILTDSPDQTLSAASTAASLFITALICVTATGPNSVSLLVALLSGGATALIPGNQFIQVVAIAFVTFVFWGSVKMSLWYVVVIGDLEKAKQTEADLAVARERLRFSADLHDVMGRNLAAISLKAQLADQLMARGDDRARAQLAEVSSLANSSLDEVRALVRGYQAPDLAMEMEGAISLLEASGARVTLTGRAHELSPERATHTAALIREATTNIIRHSNATQVSITLGADGVQIINDGVGYSDQEQRLDGTGLAGLARRIGTDGTITHYREGQQFVLTLDFPEAP